MSDRTSGRVGGIASQAAGRSGPGDTEKMPALWWLWLPLLVFVAVALSSRVAPEFHDRWILPETGILELSHGVIPAIACWLALRCLTLPAVRGRAWLRAWLVLLALGCIYIAGEELSWGQQLFLWNTPEAWQAVNDQQETNLHNVSAWFDQKPRLLLELGIVVGGIVLPLAALARPALRRWRFAVVLPPLLCLPSAVLAEIARLTEPVGDLFGAPPYLFHRASEVQELYFYLFILLYAVVLRRRLIEESAASG